MSPAGRIEPRLPEVGRIRLGTKTRAANGKERPADSETLIFTSASKGTLSRLAAVVGGAVEGWPNGQEPWRLTSAVDSLAVQVPPQAMREPCYEEWSAAGLLCRCDGETCEVPEDRPDGPVLVTQPCHCDPPDDMTCRVTTRLSVVLPQVPGLGVWTATTHSAIAAGELAGQLRLLQLSGSTGLVPATIAIERERTRRGRAVPVLRLRFHVGLAELQGREAPAGELGA